MFMPRFFSYLPRYQRASPHCFGCLLWSFCKSRSRLQLLDLKSWKTVYCNYSIVSCEYFRPPSTFYLLCLSRFPLNSPYLYPFSLNSELPVSPNEICLSYLYEILFSFTWIKKLGILFLLPAWCLSCFTCCVYLFISSTTETPQGWHSGQLFTFCPSSICLLLAWKLTCSPNSAIQCPWNWFPIPISTTQHFDQHKLWQRILAYAPTLSTLVYHVTQPLGLFKATTSKHFLKRAT